MNQESVDNEVADEDQPIRVGSPFTADPDTVASPRSIETLYDVGPMRYTAMGAVAAAAFVLVFAAVATWWFPAGGVLIAALGCALSLFGMASVYRFTAIGLLIVHLGLFVFNYSQTLS